VKALSIRQPWAWAIIHAMPDMEMAKDIENRDWYTGIRERVLVHAAKGCTRAEYEEFVEFAMTVLPPGTRIPPLKELPRGGIIGSVVIADCVTRSTSRWFFGKFGFVLKDRRPMDFIPYRGNLGFFEVPGVSV
jgi:hypothetical protein